MDTPTAYKTSLKEKVITLDMLADCLYSCNKRVKNWQDKEREYREDAKNRQIMNRYYYDKYDNEGKAREKKEEYYAQKELLLTFLQPVCIHREPAGYERRRIYDYEDEYKDHEGQFVWENSFYDPDQNREVFFGDILLKDKPRFRYYLFYDTGIGYSFHQPLPAEDLGKYDLPVKQISKLVTTGEDVRRLLSNQFVSKVIQLIKDGGYTFTGTTGK